MDGRHIDFRLNRRKTIRLTGKSLQLAPAALETFLDCGRFSGVLESSQLHSGTSYWNTEIDHSRVFTLWKMAVATSQVFCWFVCFLKRRLLNIYQHTTGKDPRERGKHDAVAHGNRLVSSLHQTEVQRALERESRDPSSRPGFAPEGS